MSDESGSAAAATRLREEDSVYDRGDTVCVIGAGGSGLAAIKNLREAGFGVDCYERETSVGGAWNWRHNRSPVYASTHLISSRPTTQFPDFPMPDSWPDYPHHAQLLSYFERYADHFALRDDIWFGTEVVRLAPVERPGGGPPRWDVTIRGSRGGSPRTMRYTAVIAANGHNWSPRMPAYEGLDEYRGTVLHASAYKDAQLLRGRKVLVVGGGNTGCDLAVDAAQQAAMCWHSTRRGAWHVPKYVLGRPVDQLNNRLRALRLPLRLRRWLARQMLRFVVGDLTRFGLAQPDHHVYERPPVVNSHLVYYVGHGAITPVPDVARFEGNAVVFTDGRSVEPDLVLLATGYLPRFEFVPAELLGVDGEGRPRLALEMFAPGCPTLAVAGLVDAGVFPVAHWQTVLIAQWLRLLQTAPDAARAVWEGLPGDGGQRSTAGRPKAGSGHWSEVSQWSYLEALERALHQVEAAQCGDRR
ncbi:MAG TPA: NAD(P)-binding domain-containing protein [Micromonosporaceae bacterium]|nr:NAD(P)-binding domain-containing protein [Micromonosporaceae bacterium]